MLATLGYTPESLAKKQNLEGQLLDYQRQIGELESQKQQALMQSELSMQGRGTAALLGEKGIIERGYNSRIAAKSAEAGIVQMQYNMEQGNREEAMKMADTVMKYKMYEYEQKVADLEWTFSTYTDLFQIMSKQENDKWDKQYKVITDERDEAYRQERAKMDDYFKQAGLELDWAQEARLGAETGTSGIDTTSRYIQDPQNPNVSIPNPNYGKKIIEEKLLSVAEAKSLGVPYGTTESKAMTMGKVPGEVNLEDVVRNTKTTFQQYKDIGYTRKQIEDQWKADNSGSEIPKLVSDVLDELFGQSKPWYKFW